MAVTSWSIDAPILPGPTRQPSVRAVAVIGDPVNVLARLQAAAGPGRILVDEPTHTEVAHAVASQDLGSLRPAGKSDWVHAFNVLGLRYRYR